MSPLEALSILIQAAELAPLNRQGHIAVQRAQEVVSQALSKPAEEKKEPQP